jgi:hypothetical protein
MTDSSWHEHADRWLAADREGHDLEAEAAFGLALRDMPVLAPSGDLEARIWRATRRLRLRRLASAVLRLLLTGAAATGMTVVVLYLATGPLLLLGARLLTGAMTGLMRGLVWITLAFSEGLDVWSFLARIGRAVSGALVTPEATTVLVLLELIGGAAFYILSRVLAREKEIPQ